MLLKATLLIGILLSSAPVRAVSGGVDARERFVAARQQADAARRDQFAAQARLTALKTEQRLQLAIAAAEPPPAPRQNPEFARAQSDVRTLELQVRKLSERLAPAHPELITAVAELDTARNQLAGIPETIETGPPLVSAENYQAAEAVANIARAEQELRQADDRLIAALEVERQALAELLMPQESVSAPPSGLEQVEITEPAPQQDAGWILAGIVSAAVLLILIASRWRSDISSSTTQPAVPSAPVALEAPTSRRLVYSASETPTPAAPTTKTRRAPIIPRRRVG